jgi:hypothetical protein
MKKNNLKKSPEKDTQKYKDSRDMNNISVKKCRDAKINVVPQLEDELSNLRKTKEKLTRENKEQMELLEKNYDLVKIRAKYPEIAELLKELDEFQQLIINN